MIRQVKIAGYNPEQSPSSNDNAIISQRSSSSDLIRVQNNSHEKNPQAYAQSPVQNRISQLKLNNYISSQGQNVTILGKREVLRSSSPIVSPMSSMNSIVSSSKGSFSSLNSGQQTIQNQQNYQFGIQKKLQNIPSQQQQQQQQQQIQAAYPCSQRQITFQQASQLPVKMIQQQPIIQQLQQQQQQVTYASQSQRNQQTKSQIHQNQLKNTEIIQKQVQPKQNQQSRQITQQPLQLLAQNTFSQGKLAQQAKQIQSPQLIQQQIDSIQGNCIKIISKEQAYALEQNDQIICNIGGKVSDLSSEIQRLLGLNERLIQEALSWRQKYDLIDMKRQILEQELKQKKLSAFPSEILISTKENYFDCSSKMDYKSRDSKKKWKIRSPSCGSISDSSPKKKEKEGEYNFQEMIKEIGELESLEKIQNEECNKDEQFEENENLRKKLSEWEQLDQDSSFNDQPNPERVQKRMQALEEELIKLKEQLMNQELRELEKDYILQSLQEEKDQLKQSLCNRVQDLQTGISNYSHSRALYSFFDQAEIFYHTQGTSPKLHTAQFFSQKNNNNDISNRQSNENEENISHSPHHQNYITVTHSNSSIHNNFKSKPPSPQTESDSKSISTQAKGIIEKTNALIRDEYPIILNPSPSVKTIEFNFHQSQSQIKESASSLEKESHYKNYISSPKNLSIHTINSKENQIQKNPFQNQSTLKAVKTTFTNSDNTSFKNNSNSSSNITQNGYHKGIQNNNTYLHSESQINSYHKDVLLPIENKMQKYLFGSPLKVGEDNSIFPDKISPQVTQNPSQSSSGSDSFCVNYSFSERENCSSSKKTMEILFSPQFVQKSNESFNPTKQRPPQNS